jgi:hypothetical protein
MHFQTPLLVAASMLLTLVVSTPTKRFETSVAEEMAIMERMPCSVSYLHTQPQV